MADLLMLKLPFTAKDHKIPTVKCLQALTPKICTFWSFFCIKMR